MMRVLSIYTHKTLGKSQSMLQETNLTFVEFDKSEYEFLSEDVPLYLKGQAYYFKKVISIYPMKYKITNVFNHKSKHWNTSKTLWR